MFTRECTQKIEWVDIQDKIVSEKTTIKWKLFGITSKKRVLEVQSITPDGKKATKIGFSNG